uniref:C2H2-type domain-containing protein n=1 Tax=Globisporangium ultimum (strain ATCC 200006 / CBS 805.95 / DAOM BR144) TaxID=431595 RepID=K3WF64_GLOUD
MATSIITPRPQFYLEPPTQSPKQRLTSSGLRFREPSQDRPFLCPFANCGGRFHRKFTLHEHMKTHTGEQPHQCPIKSCGKRFSTSGNLARHKRLHALHKMECPVAGCTRIFTSQEMLAKHQKVHAGSAVHSCVLPGCGKTFSTAGNLTRHMKTQHGLSNSMHRFRGQPLIHLAHYYSKSSSPTNSESSHCSTASSSPAASSSNESSNGEFPAAMFISPPPMCQPFCNAPVAHADSHWSYQHDVTLQTQAQTQFSHRESHQPPTCSVLTQADICDLFECLF